MNTEHYMARMDKRSPEVVPLVMGRCPVCGQRSLFLGVGGYVTCSWVNCTDPSAATDLLEGSAS